MNIIIATVLFWFGLLCIVAIIAIRIFEIRQKKYLIPRQLIHKLDVIFLKVWHRIQKVSFFSWQKISEYIEEVPSLLKRGGFILWSRFARLVRKIDKSLRSRKISSDNRGSVSLFLTKINEHKKKIRLKKKKEEI